MELNQRPTGYEPAALTPELRPHVDIIIAQLASSGDEFMRNNHSYYQNLSFFGSFGDKELDYSNFPAAIRTASLHEVKMFGVPMSCLAVSDRLLRYGCEIIQPMI